MSNAHMFLKSAFPKSPLQNGLGRYICQLQRVTLKFCKNNGSSKGMRNFIENGKYSENKIWVSAGQWGSGFFSLFA